MREEKESFVFLFCFFVLFVFEFLNFIFLIYFVFFPFPFAIFGLLFPFSSSLTLSFSPFSWVEKENQKLKAELELVKKSLEFERLKNANLKNQLEVFFI